MQCKVICTKYSHPASLVHNGLVKHFDRWSVLISVKESVDAKCICVCVLQNCWAKRKQFWYNLFFSSTTALWQTRLDCELINKVSIFFLVKVFKTNLGFQLCVNLSNGALFYINIPFIKSSIPIITRITPPKTYPRCVL